MERIVGVVEGIFEALFVEGFHHVVQWEHRPEFVRQRSGGRVSSVLGHGRPMCGVSR